MKSFFEKGLNIKFANLFVVFILIIILLFQRYYFRNVFIILSVLFTFFNIMFFFMGKKMTLNLTTLVLRITGFLRFMVIPIIMSIENIYVDERISYIMCVEIIVQYITVIIFFINEHKFGNGYVQNNMWLGSMTFVLNRYFIVTIIVIGTILVSKYNIFFIQYFILSLNKPPVDGINNVVMIILNLYFLVLYLTCVLFIKKIPFIPDSLKIFFSILVSIIYINGRAISNNNISRWTLLVSLILIIYILSIIYNKYKKLLISYLLPLLTVLSIVSGTAIKVLISKKGIQPSYEESLLSVVSYKSLNAYFSGPTNVSIALDLASKVKLGIMGKIQIFLTDLFLNFPLLNKIFDDSNSSFKLFNRYIYKSDIASDQIIPLFAQLNLSLGIVGIFIYVLVLFISLTSSQKIKKSSNVFELFCFLNIAFYFALVNCINMTIMFQIIWITILPVFIMLKLNLKWG